MKPINKLNKVLLLCLAASPLLIMSESATAACAWRGGLTAPMDRTLNFGPNIIRRDMPIGTVIDTASTGAYASGQTLFGCNTPWTMPGQLIQFPTLSTYGNNVYNTNISGIGIRIRRSDVGTLFAFSVPGLANAYLALKGDGITAELVKTTAGAVGAGAITTGVLAKISIAAQPGYNVTASLAGTNTITPVGCSVNKTAIDVALSPAAITDFSGVGSTAKPKNFTVDLTCDVTTKVKMMLDGTRAGPAGVLSLNAAPDQASGIGIQLVRGTTPVALGTVLDFGAAPTTGLMQLPLTARYYQTAAPIAEGSANSTATFTMTYN